jgi:hemerythrin superfamily protein
MLRRSLRDLQLVARECGTSRTRHARRHRERRAANVPYACTSSMHPFVTQPRTDRKRENALRRRGGRCSAFELARRCRLRGQHAGPPSRRYGADRLQKLRAKVGIAGWNGRSWCAGAQAIGEVAGTRSPLCALPVAPGVNHGMRSPERFLRYTTFSSSSREGSSMKLLRKLTPGITTMIRMDHTHVLSTFHQYRTESSPDKKQALVTNVCDALEIHAQLEEEIFYPEMRSIDRRQVQKSLPEHQEMKRLVARLRRMEPSDPDYDVAFLELMRDVMHHVAEEETTLLPEAEIALAGRLEELGIAMTKRRLQLAAPRAGEIVATTARSHPAMVVGAAALLAIGAYVTSRAYRSA